MKALFNVIIVGAGHAGLSASYYLKESGISHLVLEQGQLGESWLSQRWDSFRMNTADKHNKLPGEAVTISEDRFSSAKSLADKMRNFAATHFLPIRTGTKVHSIEQKHQSDLFQINVESNGSHESFLCRKVIIASGSQNVKQVSPFESRIGADIRQLHSSEYCNPEQLPSGEVLIVGSGQSGCQIAEDLIAAGRKVFLSTSRVPRCPRRYRGKDVMDWLISTGFFNTRRGEVADPAILQIRTPLLKGTQGGQKSLSLQALAKKGAVLLGRLQEAEQYTLRFAGDTLENIAFADEFSVKVKAMIDMFIRDSHISASPVEADPDDEPNLIMMPDPILTLDIGRQNITTIIWATGFRANFDYIKLPVFDALGNIKHRDGIAEVPGVYFLGLHWLTSRKSDVLFGIKEDARFITHHILSTLKSAEPEGAGKLL